MTTNVKAVPTHTFDITLRDVDHFYKVVKWLNKHVGMGKSHWQMRYGKILRHLKEGKTVNQTVLIYVDSFDTTSALYLTLL